jgi:hypothetical protein
MLYFFHLFYIKVLCTNYRMCTYIPLNCEAENYHRCVIKELPPAFKNVHINYKNSKQNFCTNIIIIMYTGNVSQRVTYGEYTISKCYNRIWMYRERIVIIKHVIKHRLTYREHIVIIKHIIKHQLTYREHIVIIKNVINH